MLGHFEAVEADFQGHYGLNLREVLWGPERVGVRRVRALVNGLPLTGVLYREAVLDGRSWSMTDELLATLIEVVDWGNRLLYAANTKKGTQPPKPIVIDRPKVGEQLPEPKPKASTKFEVYELLKDNVVWDEN